MERRFLIIITIALLSACSNAGTFIKVAGGNFRFGQGEYEKSNIEYLHALEKDFYSEIIHYNLGNVYYVVGEPSAAQDEWRKASLTENKSLQFNIYFNLGVLQYDVGEYQKAFKNFKQALKIDPFEIDAKKNLELSLQKLLGKSTSGNATVSVEPVEPSRQDENEINRILEFVRRKEAGWLVNTPTQDDTSDTQDW